MLFAHPYQCPSVKSVVHSFFVRVGVIRGSRRLETGINMFFNQIPNLGCIQPIRIFSR
jgi:hypothetical protein